VCVGAEGTSSWGWGGGGSVCRTFLAVPVDHPRDCWRFGGGTKNALNSERCQFKVGIDHGFHGGDAGTLRLIRTIAEEGKGERCS